MRMDVTIELDIDEDDWTGMEALSDKCMEEEDDEVIIDNPISLSQVNMRIPGSVRIRNLSKDVRDFISTNLTVPATISIGSWEMVADFLQANNYLQCSYIDLNCKDPWKPFENMHAQILVNALEKVQRVDILVKLKSFVESDSYLQDESEEYQHLSTVPVATPTSSTQSSSSDVTKKILILHFETTAQETKDYRWFRKNLRKHLKQLRCELNIFDVEELESQDSGNIIQSLDTIFYKFPHIIVCFNDSYNRAISQTQSIGMSLLRKSIHEKTVVEFMQNGMRNLRFRCVLLPGIEKVDLHWTSVSYQYIFPDSYKLLLEKLTGLKLTDDLQTTSIQNDDTYSITQ